MKRSVRAAVLVGPQRLETWALPRPEIGDDDALLRVEACSVCRTDVSMYDGVPAHFKEKYRRQFPYILGHEPVGTIEEIGATAAARWGVCQGDRVAVHFRFSCGLCPSCAAGHANECVLPGSFGSTCTERTPSLFGGYAEYLYLPPGTVVQRIQPGTPPDLAALFNAMGAGLHWAVEAPQLKPGQSIVIFGPGQRGLCSVVSAKFAGAGFVGVIGLERHLRRFEVAKVLGADFTLAADLEDPVRRIRQIYPSGVDVVVDTTPGDPLPFGQGIRMLRDRGVLVRAGNKDGQEARGFSPDDFRPVGPTSESATFRLTIVGVHGVSVHNQEKALRLIETNPDLVGKLRTHTFSIEQAEQAVLTVAGRVNGVQSINVVVSP